ncbi:hypothetical protein ACQVT2_28020 [Bacillus paranthracis]|uniref:hypothetical protein n=1 Tax=Bacillus cereus group TaxID=86661 RepID=UPI0022E6A32F|nr:hypothetical protein [Bacillus cereus group sp. Bc253]MDA2158620.1 hypothetical protein [Bacillus cereus group sp. Bc253]
MLLNRKVQNTFEPITNFSSNRSQITTQIRGKKNENIPMKLKLQKELSIPVKQVTFMDFIDICFPNSEGYFCIFRKGETNFGNIFYDKEEMEQKIIGLFEKSWGMNCYISYSSYFSKKKKFKTVEETVSKQLENGAITTSTVKKRKVEELRTQNNIVKTYLLAQDLDFYKYNISVETAISVIARLVREGKIICPTMILHTGRGIQLVWAVKPFTNIKGYTHDLEWRAIQNKMFDIFEEAGLHPDTVVKNPSAVTRAPETVNRASRTIVNVFYCNAANLLLSDFMFLHDIDPLADRLVKPSKKQKTKQKSGLVPFVPKTTNTENWNEFSLNRNREEDIFIFVKTLNERKDAKHYIGMRNWLALVLRFHALVSTNGNKEYALERVQSLVKLMDLTETNANEIIRRSEPAEKYFNEWVQDTWDKTKYMRGGLFYTNKKMLEIMRIEKDYEIQWKMKTIKSRTHKYKEEIKKLKAAKEQGKEIQLDKEVQEAIEASRRYDAYRKRVENHGLKEADNHTWEAYQERRNELLEAKKDDDLTKLEQAIKELGQVSIRKLAEYLGWGKNKVARLKKEIGKN